MKLWNPAAFFISLIMSFIMPLIFGVPMGLPVDVLIYLEPVRWLIAYLLVSLAVNPLGFHLAGKVFDFNPAKDSARFWNPVAFFISLIMSFIMPLIFGVPMGLPFDVLIYLEPVRWLIAYLLVTLAVNPVGFHLAKQVFGFSPREQ